MNLKITLCILFFFVISCSLKENKIPQNQNQAFRSDLTELKTYFKIPGLAVLVKKDGKIVYEDYLGLSNIKLQSKPDSATLFPVASLTKTFAGVLTMKLLEKGKISLEDPINLYISQPNLSDSIQIKHVLSHTSQGKIGENFYYSSRFGWLTQVIEKASGKSFQEFMQTEIFNPLKLKNTFLLQDSIQLIDRQLKIAQPYSFDGQTQEGFIDYGFSSSAGIISTARDLAAFDEALDKNLLISEKSKNQMFSPFHENSPYGYGIFSQKFQQKTLVWAYGQYDCYSSLYLKIPDENLTLILLANNNLMSDPARLIYGDALSSLFVISFLKNYIYELKDMPILESNTSIRQVKCANSVFYREKLLAQALAESFMAQFEDQKIKKSRQLLEKTFALYPNYKEYADLTLLHNLAFLKDIVFFKKLKSENTFDKEIEEIGAHLYQKDPENPYLNIYLGTFYDRQGNQTKARLYFEKIINSPNFSKNWYIQEAENWLKQQNI